MYIISGRGRKSGVARATGATASLAPMRIFLTTVKYFSSRFGNLHYSHPSVNAIGVAAKTPH